MIFIPEYFPKVVKPSEVDLCKRFLEIESGKLEHLLSLLRASTHRDVHDLLAREVLHRAKSTQDCGCYFSSARRLMTSDVMSNSSVLPVLKASMRMKKYLR